MDARYVKQIDGKAHTIDTLPEIAAKLAETKHFSGNVHFFITNILLVARGKTGGVIPKCRKRQRMDQMVDEEMAGENEQIVFYKQQNELLRLEMQKM